MSRPHMQGGVREESLNVYKRKSQDFSRDSYTVLFAKEAFRYRKALNF